ncbi:hypothetical protein [Exiguobacterium sp. s133]|nr:hypothetical protein [Exiguobacterium sp. s133]
MKKEKTYEMKNIESVVFKNEDGEVLFKMENPKFASCENAKELEHDDD